MYDSSTISSNETMIRMFIATSISDLLKMHKSDIHEKFELKALLCYGPSYEMDCDEMDEKLFEKWRSHKPVSNISYTINTTDIEYSETSNYNYGMQYITLSEMPSS